MASEATKSLVLTSMIVASPRSGRIIMEAA